MALTLITLAAIGLAASGDSVAAVDIPEDGQIMGIDWTITSQAAGGGMGNDDQAVLQLSFLSTRAFTVNDIRGVISMAGVSNGVLTTSGMTATHANKYVGFVEPLEVAGGERIHLHYLEGGAAVMDVWCVVQLSVRKTIRRSRRRR